MEYRVLDTSAIIHLLRNKEKGKQIRELLKEKTLVVSTMTKAELASLKIQLGWGNKRLSLLDALMAKMIYVDIINTNDEFIDAYAQIDAYSQGRGESPMGKYKKGSAVNMGKNDLWIAATAFVLNTPLITTDKDFQHLHQVFIEVIEV